MAIVIVYNKCTTRGNIQLLYRLHRERLAMFAIISPQHNVRSTDASPTRIPPLNPHTSHHAKALISHKQHSDHTKPHHTTSHYTTLHRITPHHITAQHTSPHHITSRHTTAQHTTLPHKGSPPKKASPPHKSPKDSQPVKDWRDGPSRPRGPVNAWQPPSSATTDQRMQWKRQLQKLASKIRSFDKVGVVWCGVMWCDTIQCDVMWCGMVWYDAM